MLYNGNNKSKFSINLPILNAAEAAEWDRYSIQEKNIDSRLLMGWAGYSVFMDILSRQWFEKTERIHILVGSGNNGGDGYVIAWHLLSSTNKKIQIWQTSQPRSEDAQYFLSLCQSLKNTPGSDTKLIIDQIDKFATTECTKNEVVVDAVFGTGLNKPPSGELQSFFTALNSVSGLIKIAIDVPSGIYANGDMIQHVTFKADYTYSFGSWKMAHLFEPGINACGEVIISPIGFFPLEHKPERRLLLKSKSSNLRVSDGHKYKSGVLFLIGGSEGMEGAAIMAAKSFLALGGGLAKIYSHSDSMKTTLGDNPEFMIRNFRQTIDLESSFLESLPAEPKNQVVVIGPGLQEKLSENFWKRIALEGGINLIIDGSGLSQLPSFENVFFENTLPNLILTPHKGEAEKLLGRKISNIREAALEISNRYNAHVYLKGPGGILVLKSKTRPEEIYLNSRHRELATGGTGDVLCGVLANFLFRFSDDHNRGLETALWTYMRSAELVVEDNLKNRDFLTPSELITTLRKAADETLV